MRSPLLLFLFSVIFLVHVAPKAVVNSENINKFMKDPWKYVTKFAIAPGKGEFKGRLQFTKAMQKANLPNKVNLTMFVYLDEEWEKVKELDSCAEKASLARLTKYVQVPTDGKWGAEVSGFLTQSIRTHVWFFVLADCERNLAPYTQAGRIKWSLQVYNSDRSHFSQEENGMILPLMLVMTIIVGFFISNSIKFIKFYRTEESIDYPTLIVTVALFFELVSVVCQVAHLWIYSFDGKGSFIFNLASHALTITSQFLITCLLLLMAYGWSINFLRFSDMNIFLPLGIILGVAHILMVGIGKLGDNDHYKYHDYENWTGAFVMGMRIFLFIFWVFLYKKTRSNAKQTEMVFFNQLGVLSTVYFMAVPAMVFLATTVVAPYYRHKVVTIGTLMLQIVTLVIFTLLFTTKSNKYYQISMKGKALLPSNKLL